MNVEGLSLDQMRAALAIAEEGGFSAAARRFNRTQSAVSYAVAELEAQLGVKLFDRSGSRAQPTAEANLLLREIARIVGQTDSLKHKARAISHGTEAQLNLVVDALYDRAQLGPILLEFQAAFPGTAVNIHTEILSGVTKRVVETCHVGILASLPSAGPGIMSATLPHIRLVPVARRDHALAALAGQSLEFARGEHVQIVVADRSQATAGDYFVLGTRLWTVGDIETKHMLLRAGIGWGFMPEHLVAPEIESGDLVVLALEGLPVEDHQPVFVIWSEERSLGPCGQWFVGKLRSLRSFSGSTK
ncbi:LysR family transcriptional regulator [Inquilinus limosus]|uniref:LysR family transcriptional regulator n=1 Tax=Inquilinus limosus TaxID=171674 RepID=UPI003F155B70